MSKVLFQIFHQNTRSMGPYIPTGQSSAICLAPLVDATGIIAQHATEAWVCAGHLSKEDDAAQGDGNDNREVDSSRQQFTFIIRSDPGLRLHRPHVSTSVLIHGLSNSCLTIHETHVRLGHLEIFLLCLLLSVSSGLWQSTQRLGVPCWSCWWWDKALHQVWGKQCACSNRQHVGKKPPRAAHCHTDCLIWGCRDIGSESGNGDKTDTLETLLQVWCQHTRFCSCLSPRATRA